MNNYDKLIFLNSIYILLCAIVGLFFITFYMVANRKFVLKNKHFAVERVKIKKNINIINKIIGIPLCILLIYNISDIGLELIEKNYIKDNGVISSINYPKNDFLNIELVIDKETFYLPKKLIKTGLLEEGKRYIYVYSKRSKLILDIESQP